MTAPAIVLRAERVSKVYPGVRALDEVDFDIRAGAVNVLVGENGAGKSTLMKIIAGVERPTSGALLLDGAPVRFHDTKDAGRHGVGIVFQEFNLFGNLSIAENLFVAHELTRYGADIDHAEQERRAADILRLLKQNLSPATPVDELAVGQQQIVEIAKALARDVRVLILDEPTSALSAAETEILFEVIGTLKARGVAIVYISHRMEELTRIGDFVTVLRDGKITGAAQMKDIDAGWITARLIGTQAPSDVREAARSPGKTLLRASGLSLPSEKGGWRLREVDISVRANEIVGIYGLLGAGRTELLDCLMGRRPDFQGAIEIDGAPLQAASVPECIGQGLALAPEDRRREGLVMSLSIAENLTLSSLGRLCSGARISPARETEAAQRMIRELSIKVADASLPVGVLSGGNQQKVVIGKALLTQPKVLLMDEPTRGIDIGAKFELYRLIRRLAGEGLGVLFATSELEEALLLADRIAVMRAGRIVRWFERAEATPENILIAAGQKEAA